MTAIKFCNACVIVANNSINNNNNNNNNNNVDNFFTIFCVVYIYIS